MKRKFTIYILIILLLFILTGQVFADNLQHSFDMGIGTLDGYTEYEIGAIDSDLSSGYGFRSLLEFPLDVEMLNISYKNNLKIQPLNIGGIEIDLAKNIDDEAGTFKDSDWLLGTGIHVKDIYSESSTKADDISKWNLKIRAPWNNISGNLSYSLIIGYKEDKYKLTGSDTTEFYPSSDNDPVYIDGDTIKYEAIYKFPYVGVDFKTSLGQWDFQSEIHYSNWVDMEDEDYHILRDKLSKSKADGESLMIKAGANYALNTSSDIFFNIDYNRTEVDGSQDQYFSDGSFVEGIDYRAAQEYTQYTAGLSWKF